MLTSAESNLARKGSVIEVTATTNEPLSHVIEERFEADRDALRLDGSEIVVSTGAGVGGPENLKIIDELAQIMNAPVVATRKIVDLGWMPRQLQIGLTGRSIGPKLYIAVGVRGAFNHMVGVARAGTVVAINNDPNAAIFRNCDYGLVSDFAEIVPLLSRRLREVKPKPSDS
jgi:electron transfer flavoprotein alpha subunit